jgi:L-seryl-tRNA(Ser) seleniumtransferase
MEDLGSGTLIDFSKYGLLKEPTVQESVSSGADIVTFSGDKLLGGPQAGIIVGKKDPLEQIKENPLTRALRVDKLTFAALESTLSLYRDEKIAIDSIPTLRMLTLPLEMIENKAKQLAEMLAGLEEPKLSYTFLQLTSRAGGGALPYLTVPTVCLGIKIHKISANSIEKFMRGNSPPIIGRLENDLFIMDLRTILEDELSIIKTAFANLLNKA